MMNDSTEVASTAGAPGAMARGAAPAMHIPFGQGGAGGNVDATADRSFLASLLHNNRPNWRAAHIPT